MPAYIYNPQPKTMRSSTNKKFYAAKYQDSDGKNGSLLFMFCPEYHKTPDRQAEVEVAYELQKQRKHAIKITTQFQFVFVEEN